MSTIVTVAGQTYQIPSEGDSGWASEVSGVLIALANNTLQTGNTTFAITSNFEFDSSTYGVRAHFFSANSGIPATVGRFRLENDASVSWRNFANSADLELKANTDDKLHFNGNPLLNLALGNADEVLRMNNAGDGYEFAKIQDINVDDTAAIAYSKLNLALSLVNADVHPGAAIAWSKLDKTGSSLSDITTRSHTQLTDIGSNTHPQIDSHIAASTGVHGVSGNVVGTSDAQTLTNKALTNPNINGYINILAQGELRLRDLDSSNYISIKSPSSLASNVNFTLPGDDGSLGQVLRTDGNGVLSWTTVATSGLTENYIYIGDNTNNQIEFDTSLTGDVQANYITGLLIKSGVIDNDNINASAGIDATKLANGSVDNTEFQKLGSVGVDGTGEIVSTDGTQDLSNKTLIDNSVSFEDADNNLRKAQIRLNITQADGTTQHTLPSTSGELLSEDSANIVKNKTFTSGTGNGNLGIDTSPSTGGTTTTLRTNQTAPVIVDLPGSTTKLVGDDTTDTLSNKTLSDPRINDNGSLDTANAASISIGDTNATTLNLSRTGQTTVVKGDLQVDGTTTTVNSATLDVADANITVNVGGNDASAEGAGLTVEGTGASDLASLKYDSTLNGKWKAGLDGSEKELINVDDAQSLSNKTIDADLNTISNLAHGAEVDNPSSGVHGVTGSVVGTTDAQTLSAKTLSGANISDYLEFDEASAPTTPAANKNRIFFDSTDGSPYYKNDAGETVPFGSGSGSGGINYITNPDTEVNTSGWTTNSGSVAITRTTTPGEVLRGAASFKIAATTSVTGDYAEYQFTLDEADKNRLMRISFDSKDISNYTAGYFEVVIVKDPGGSESIITPSVTAIPGGPAKFEALFVTDAQTSLSLRIKTVAAGVGTSFSISIDDVRVTPELTVTANPETEWEAITLSGNIADSDSAYMRRVGSNMQVRANWNNVAAWGTSIFNFTIPNSLTIDTAKVRVNFGTIGHATAYDDSAGVFYNATMQPAGTTAVRIEEWGQTGFPMTWQNNADELSIFFEVPIAEWAGSVVTTANSRVEYAYTDTTWDGSDSTTKYGPSGGAMGGSITSSALKTITWQTPIQPTDKIWLEFSKDQVNWVEANMARLGSGNEPVVNQINAAGTNGSGVHVYGISSTQTAVLFLQYKNIANDDSPAVAWDSSSAYWRLCKSSNPLGIGTGLATATQAGALEKNFRWQTKTASNQSSTNTSMITFNNITSGKTYRLDFKGDASSTDTTSTMRVLFYIPSGVESTESPTIGVDASSSYTWGTDVYVRISDSKLVKANASSIVIGALVDGTNSLLSNIAVTITELPNHEETTDFT